MTVWFLLHVIGVVLSIGLLWKDPSNSIAAVCLGANIYFIVEEFRARLAEGK